MFERLATSIRVMFVVVCACTVGACDTGSPGEPPANTLDKIRQRGRVIVATEAAFEPFEFVRDGKIVGYNKEILDYVVAGLGVPLEQLNLPFQGILPGLIARKFDFAATSIAMNEERARKYAYTQPIGAFEDVVLVRAGDRRVATADDLNGLVVATQLASSAQPIVEVLDARLQAQGGAGYADLRLFTAFPETFVALSSGQVDAIVVASTSAAVLLQNMPGRYALATRLGNTSHLGWVTRPEDLELRDFIDSKIDELRASGKLRELQLKWFGFEMDTPASGYLPAGAL